MNVLSVRYFWPNDPSNAPSTARAGGKSPDGETCDTRQQTICHRRTADGVAGYHADVAYFLKERGVSFIGEDEWNDVSPTTFPGPMGLPVHQLALVSLGVDIFDNLDLERVAETSRRLKRWEFLFSAAPLNIEKGMGSPLNPIAIY